jgi:hypothetical protein
MSENWVVGEWGDACGPRPAPRGAGGGSIQISESGGELVFSGGGYPRTNGCFEMGGGISVTSHSAAPRGWRTRCSTSAADPRKATIVTTISATDSSISFDETGQYQFILKEQNCTASVRRSRSYSLVRRQGDEPPAATTTAPVASPAPTPTPTPTPTPEVATKPPPDVETPRGSCASPGEVARVEVRPARRLMKPGETFTPKAVLLDGNGCRVGQGPAWSVPPHEGQGGEAKVTVSPAGTIAVAADAPEGEYVVLAGVNGRAARVTVEVVSPERYAQLLATGVGQSDEAAVAVIATSHLGSSAATAEDSASRRKLMFLGVVGTCVLALGAACLVLLRRTRVEHEEIEELVPGETKMTVVKKKRLVARTANAPPMVCPTCKRGFPDGAVFCPDHGVKLEKAVPGAPAPAPAPQPLPAASAQRKVCPACGTRYEGNATFCGKEGATLVLAN